MVVILHLLGHEIPLTDLCGISGIIAITEKEKKLRNTSLIDIWHARTPKFLGALKI